VSPQQFNRDYKRFFGDAPGRVTKSFKQSLRDRLSAETDA
jgi:hypothetical protein